MNNQQEKDNTSFNRSMQQQPNLMLMPTSNLQANYNNQRNSSSIRNELEQIMQVFWKERMSDICDNPNDVRDAHTLPLARIKKVMKSDEQVKMISADTPVVFAKACEMLIMELSKRAWIHTQQNKRRTLQRNDVANAIRNEDTLDFLQDVVPMERAYPRQDLVSLENQFPEGYIPMMVNNMQSINQSEVAPEGEGEGEAEAVATNNNNHGFTFPMNFGYKTNNVFSQYKS